MKLQFPRQSSFIPLLNEWVDANGAEIKSGVQVQFTMNMRTGFVRRAAAITIHDDPDGFETDWKWAASTFPSPLKSLAKVLHAKNMWGVFQVGHADGSLTLRKVESGRLD